MVKWDEEIKLKMLLAIIEDLNPVALPWDKIATTMGPDFTSEAVRGQYKTIKKGFKPTNGDSTATTPSSGKTKTTKAKTPASASATKGRKRKVAEANINEDEEESALFTPKSQKIKKEADANGKAIGAALDGISSEVFKADEEGEGVDLENDVLYDAA